MYYNEYTPSYIDECIIQYWLMGYARDDIAKSFKLSKELYQTYGTNLEINRVIMKQMHRELGKTIKTTEYDSRELCKRFHNIKDHRQIKYTRRRNRKISYKYIF